jgi:flagellar assembly protein FliH
MTITRRPGGLTTSPDTGQGAIIDASMSTVTVRPARLDRPLRQGSLDPGYSDPHLEEIVRAATVQAREAAHAEGYAAGWTQGRQAAATTAVQQVRVVQAEQERQRAAASQQVAELISGLSQATAAQSQASAAQWAEIADVLGDGALQLAQAVLARELRSVDDAMALNIRAALQMLADPAQAVVHLHPQDAALVSEPPDNVRIVADPAVPAGGVVALTATQRLRLDLPAALAAAAEVLRS